MTLCVIFIMSFWNDNVNDANTHTPNETFRLTWMHCNQFGNELQSVYYYQHRSASVFVMGRWWWPISLRQPFEQRLMNTTKTSARRSYLLSQCASLRSCIYKWIFRHPICILWSICYRDVSRCTEQTHATPYCHYEWMSDVCEIFCSFFVFGRNRRHYRHTSAYGGLFCSRGD